MPVARRALVDRVRVASTACRNVDELARVVFDAVTEDVPFVFGCLATTDPATGLITRAVKSHPLPMGDEDFAAAEYGAPDINQFAEIGVRDVPVGVLSLDTGGDVNVCRRFSDYMIPVFGFTDELRAVCSNRGTTWGAFALYRGAEDQPFTAADAATLATIVELVAERLIQVLFADGSGQPGSRTTSSVLIVDARDQVTDLTAAAREHIEDLGGWTGESLPANINAVAARARSSGEAASSRVRGVSGTWLSLRALPLDGPRSARSVVLTIDAAEQASVGQMTLAARGLTGREQDVAQLVLQGASTKDISSSLFLSPHTVQDHLKAIFAKLGVTSRREMIAQLVVGSASR